MQRCHIIKNRNMLSYIAQTYISEEIEMYFANVETPVIVFGHIIAVYISR